MTRRLSPFLLLIVIALVAAWWLREAESRGQAVAPPKAMVGHSHPPIEASRPAEIGKTAWDPRGRDPFRYASDALPDFAVAGAESGSRVLTPSPAEPAVRLVGWIRRGRELRAALRIAGQLVVLGTGDSSDGFEVLSLDEDQGVRLRDPQGRELTLTPPTE